MAASLPSTTPFPSGSFFVLLLAVLVGAYEGDQAGFAAGARFLDQEGHRSNPVPVCGCLSDSEISGRDWEQAGFGQEFCCQKHQIRSSSLALLLMGVEDFMNHQIRSWQCHEGHHGP